MEVITNMKKRKALMTLVFVGAASLPFLVSAQETTKIKPNNVALEAALDSGDYAAFKKLTDGQTLPPGAPTLTEEIFLKLVEARKLQKSGDKTGAEKIMTELGLKKPNHDHMKGFFQNLTSAQKETLKQAKALTDAGKSEEAKKLLTDAGIKIPEHKGPFVEGAHPRFAHLTDAQKTTMKEARALIKEGKLEEAKTLLSNAGIQPPTPPQTNTTTQQ
jgi:soluble cytochrome b562